MSDRSLIVEVRWTSECFAASVARKDPRDRNQFCVARTHFHRIVRLARSCCQSFPVYSFGALDSRACCPIFSPDSSVSPRRVPLGCRCAGWFTGLSPVNARLHTWKQRWSNCTTLEFADSSGICCPISFATQCKFDWVMRSGAQDLQTALNAVHRWGAVPLQIWCWPHQISSDGVRAQMSPRF